MAQLVERSVWDREVGGSNPPPPIALPSLSISIPAFNERETLSGVVQESIEAAERMCGDFEILVIDDGSTDGTSAIADGLARQDSRIRVIHHRQNQGFGETLKEVYVLPRKEWIFFVPGDGQIAPKELVKLAPAAVDHDLILGRRIHRRDSWMRSAQAGVYNALVSLVLGRRIRDVDSVFLLRRRALGDIEIKGRSVFIHAEVCFKIARQGGKIVEIEIEHRPRHRGVASGSSARVVAKTIWDFFKYCVNG